MPDIADDVDEHPIIFSGWSIPRILAGEKTQTRRIVKPQPPKNIDTVKVGLDGTVGYFSGDTAAFADDTTCPYGQSGDILWVREAFRLPAEADGLSPTEYVRTDKWDYISTPKRYEADGVSRGLRGGELEWGRKRPRIHMPRELCRIRLRVEDVRVERMQEITNDDAMAEGIDSRTPVRDYSAREKFSHLWNDIHGDGAWKRNDWVWVVSFSRIENE